MNGLRLSKDHYEKGGFNMETNNNQVSWLLGQVKKGHMSRREFLARTVALGMASSISASLFSSASAATPKSGGHMRLAMGHGGASDTLDPGTIANGIQWTASYGVANTLTEVDASGSVIGSLAKEWSASPDAATWTFKLRKGIEFHNGKTMTADDVIASINYHRGENSKSISKPLVESVSDIRSDGPDTVVFSLNSGNADFPFTFNEAVFGIYPSKDGAIDWKAGGSGPYILKEEEPGQFYNFERNPNYWKSGAAHVDSIELLSIVDSSARTNALITGEVDCIDRVELKTLSLLEKVDGLVVEEGAGPLHYSFPMMSKVPPFDNSDMRKAMKYGINRQEILDKILFGHGVIGNDHPISPSYRYHAADIDQIAYDPDKAKHYWQKSGLGSTPINLSAADAAFGGAVDAAVLFQASAKAAGIDIKVVREPNDGYWSNTWMKKPWSASYWGGYTTEDAMFSIAFAAEAPWNESQWSNPRFEELLRASRAELNHDLRAEMYREMQILLRDEGGSIIPMFANSVHARNQKIAHGDLSWVRGFDGRRILERWWMT